VPLPTRFLTGPVAPKPLPPTCAAGPESPAPAGPVRTAYSALGRYGRPIACTGTRARRFPAPSRALPAPLSRQPAEMPPGSRDGLGASTCTALYHQPLFGTCRFLQESGGKLLRCLLMWS
jgi:hypothetical protein